MQCFRHFSVMPIINFPTCSYAISRNPRNDFRLCIPYLKKSQGNIVNVSSLGGVLPLENTGYYCMTKAAMDMLSQCLALELAPLGVRVNSVNPGVVDTGIHVKAGLPQEVLDAYLAKAEKTHPIGRTGKAEEVANAIAFIASKEASFMTGNITPVGGGINCADPLK